MNLKKILAIYCLLFSAYSFLYADYNGQFQINENDLIFSTQYDYDVISIEESYKTEEVGAPDLPVMKVSYVIPVDMAAKDVVVSTTQSKEISGNYNLIPVQPPQLMNDNSAPIDFIVPDQKFYGAGAAYPGKLAEICADYYSMGHHVVTVAFYPVEYNPADRTVKLYPAFPKFITMAVLYLEHYKFQLVFLTLLLKPYYALAFQAIL